MIALSISYLNYHRYVMPLAFQISIIQGRTLYHMDHMYYELCIKMYQQENPALDIRLINNHDIVLDIIYNINTYSKNTKKSSLAFSSSTSTLSTLLPSLAAFSSASRIG